MYKFIPVVVLVLCLVGCGPTEVTDVSSEEYFDSLSSVQEHDITDPDGTLKLIWEIMQENCDITLSDTGIVSVSPELASQYAVLPEEVLCTVDKLSLLESSNPDEFSVSCIILSMSLPEDDDKVAEYFTDDGNWDSVTPEDRSLYVTIDGHHILMAHGKSEYIDVFRDAVKKCGIDYIEEV